MKQNWNPLQIVLVVFMGGIVLVVIAFAVYIAMQTLAIRSTETSQVITQDIPITTSLPIITPAPTPVPPRIEKFSVTPNEILIGTCFELSWEVSGEVTLVRIQRDSIAVQGQIESSGTLQDCPEDSGTLTYRLQAWDIAGVSSSADTPVYVIAPTSTPESPLIREWMLVLYLGSDDKYARLLEDTRITANLDQGRNFTGSAGCNTYTAIYTTQSVQGITISEPATTKKTCEEAIMLQEQAYLVLLPSATSYRLADGWLEFFDAEGQKILVYVSAP